MVNSNNTKLQEVEIRASLEKSKYDEVKQYLLSNSGELEKEEYIKDNYWCRSSAMSFEDARMDKVGTFSLRTRIRKTGDVEKSDLNIKLITKENDHNAWDEHETVIGSFADTEEILKTLGYKIFFTLEKTRETFAIDGYTLVLENITGFGYVMELELMLPEAEAEAGKLQIRKYMSEKLNISDDLIIAKTAVNIMMQKMAKF